MRGQEHSAVVLSTGRRRQNTKESLHEEQQYVRGTKTGDITFIKNSLAHQNRNDNFLNIEPSRTNTISLGDVM